MKLLASALALSTAFLAPYVAAQGCEGSDCQVDLAAKKKAQKKAQAAQAIEDAANAAIAFTQDYEPTPAIWKLSDEDTTIYMFGTFHVLPEGFRWRSDAFNAIVEDVDELVVETSDDDGEQAITELVMGMVVEAMSDERVPVSKRLSEGNGEKWLKIARDSEMPTEFFDRMPLIFSMLAVGISVAEDQGSMSEYGVETVLEAEFKAAEKPIGSIEDSAAVMSALLGIDEDLLLADLDEELSKWNGKDLTTLFSTDDDTPPVGTAGDGASAENDDDDIPPDPFSEEHAWAQGKTGTLLSESFGETEFGVEMFRVLLTDRNREWAEWLEDRLKQPGSILLAVGAGHLEGKDSVQLMLAERGLTAERIH